MIEIELIKLKSKQDGNEKAFLRSKQDRKEVVNFKDCRPMSDKGKAGGRGFVKHVGEVQFIDKAPLKVNIQRNLEN